MKEVFLASVLAHEFLYNRLHGNVNGFFNPEQSMLYRLHLYPVAVRVGKVFSQFVTGRFLLPSGNGLAWH